MLMCDSHPLVALVQDSLSVLVHIFQLSNVGDNK